MAYGFLTSSEGKSWHTGDESCIRKTCVSVWADQGGNPRYATGGMLDRMLDKISFRRHAPALARTSKAHLLSAHYNTRMLLSASLESLSQRQCNSPMLSFLCSITTIIIIIIIIVIKTLIIIIIVIIIMTKR